MQLHDALPERSRPDAGCALSDYLE